MSNDKIIGAIMALVSIAIIVVEFYYLIFIPLRTDSDGFLGTAVYWALALPIFIAVLGVLLITTWIGITLIRTPPPEAWDFEDLEDEESSEAGTEAQEDDKTE
jgi:hypothetical protein